MFCLSKSRELRCRCTGHHFLEDMPGLPSIRSHLRHASPNGSMQKREVTRFLAALERDPPDSIFRRLASRCFLNCRWHFPERREVPMEATAVNCRPAGLAFLPCRVDRLYQLCRLFWHRWFICEANQPRLFLLTGQPEAGTDSRKKCHVEGIMSLPDCHGR